MRLDNTCIEILNAMADGKPCFVEDLPVIYKDEKRTKQASEADIADSVIGLYAFDLIKDAKGSPDENQVMISGKGFEIHRHLEGYKRFTGKYQKYFVS